MEQNNDISLTFRDSNFKDAKPMKTVERIRGILQENGLEIEEIWGQSGVPFCHSVRIVVQGTIFSTHGKGLTKEFALASAYGEMMERLQLGHISREQKDGNYAVNNGREETVNASALLERNRKWYEIYAQRVKLFTGTDISPEEIMAQFADAAGNVSATPYYCATTNTKEYIPTALRKMITGTNGYAAGNTIEEAIVQACSEIVEREYKNRILSDEITLPTIPDDVLQHFSVAYHIIGYIRSHGFKVFVKDCSLGTKFPVICVCYIDEKTGKYHTHFGAYPIFEIALQRALTETFQGRKIESFAQYSEFSYEKTSVLSLETMREDLKHGESKRMPEFFIGSTDEKWNEKCGFTGTSNKELVTECIDFFADQGYDVLLRDSSCLGFPTCQVMIPGQSEVLISRLSPDHNDLAYVEPVEKVIRNPSSATAEDMLGLLLHINVNRRNPSAMNFSRMAKLPTTPSAEEARRLFTATLAYVNFHLGQYGNSLIQIKKLRAMPGISIEEQEYLLCLERKLTLELKGYKKDKIDRLLSLFHKPKTVAEITAADNPIEPFTLHCDGASCNESCPLYHCCYQSKIKKLANLIIAKSLAMDFEQSMGDFQKILGK